MSVLFTESFMRYQRRAPTSDELNNDLVAGGWAVRSYSGATVYPPNANINTMRWQVQADPIYAARNSAKSFSPSPSSGSIGTVLAYTFPAPATHWYMGVRLSHKRNGANPNISNLVTIGSQGIRKAGNTDTGLGGSRPTNTWDCLLQFDQVTGKTFTGISNAYVEVTSYLYPTGSDVYIEVMVDTVNNLVRVWVNDLLIVDGAFNATILAAAKAAYDQGFGIMASSGASSGTSVSEVIMRDIYALKVDATAPFARLGGTTQVLGEKPTDDAQAQFVRPNGYADNADVAALPVIPNPTVYLTGDTIGQEDRYTAAGSTVATAASIIHAVGVKTQIANYAAAAHEVAAVVKPAGGTNTGVSSMGAITPGVGFVNHARYFPTNPDTGVAWTPTEAGAAQFGLRVLS